MSSLACGVRHADPPSNATAVMLDLSGTFKNRAGAALEQTEKLLDGMADTKLRRWEKDRDSISIVALDAQPAVLWSGTLRALAELKDSGTLAALIAGRADYAQCTDIAAGFSVAAAALADGSATNKYLFVFSDLVSEPPQTSLARCAPGRHPSPPPDDFDWSSLAEVSTDVFWVPPAQAFPWKQAITAQGLSNIRIHTPSESERAVLNPPPRPKRQIGPIETQAARSQITTGLFLAGIALIVVLAVAVGAVMLARRGRPARLGTRRPSPVRRRPPSLARPRSAE